jgi:putative colanic acid biosysnthesis UDP-glucose lipid carrier transferase
MIDAPTSTIKTRHKASITIVHFPAVFVLKCLLVPAVPVFTLAICLKIADATLRGGYFLIAALTFLEASQFLGFARIGIGDLRESFTRVLAERFARWLLLMVLVVAVTYFSGLLGSLDHTLLATWAIVTPVTLWAAEIGARSWLAHSMRRTRHLRRAVIVGVTELGIRLEAVLRSDPSLRTDLLGYFEDRSPERLTVSSGATILGDTSSLAKFVASNGIEQVYITLPMNGNSRILSLIEQLRDSTASIHFVPDLFAYNPLQASFDVLKGIPIVAVCETPIHGASMLAKRISDLLVAVTALLLLLPVLLIVALCIRLESPGPILFKQKRYGLDGREILVYKFRSMTVTEDGKDKFSAARPGDRRVTKVGAFIRRTSLDELPQLFNVIKGSMSIVGPRPHPVAMNEHYRGEISGYMLRHKVKPGITGWAQVNGYRGGDDLDSMRKRIEFDIAYLQHWSLALDLKILFRTLAVVWTDRSAY